MKSPTRSQVMKYFQHRPSSEYVMVKCVQDGLKILTSFAKSRECRLIVSGLWRRRLAEQMRPEINTVKHFLPQFQGTNQNNLTRKSSVIMFLAQFLQRLPNWQPQQSLLKSAVFQNCPKSLKLLWLLLHENLWPKINQNSPIWSYCVGPTYLSSIMNNRTIVQHFVASTKALLQWLRDYTHYLDVLSLSPRRRIQDGHYLLNKVLFD